MIFYWFRYISKKRLVSSGGKDYLWTVFIWDGMTIFDDYKKYGACSVSPSLLWEYGLSDFDWWKSRKIVVRRILERGWLEDYYAGFNLYGGIEGFRKIIKEIPFLSPRDMNFACIAFGLKKEDLKCYKQKLLRERLLRWLQSESISDFFLPWGKIEMTEKQDKMLEPSPLKKGGVSKLRHISFFILR